MKPGSLADRVARRLVAVYPCAFRERHGAHLLQTMRDARRGGTAINSFIDFADVLAGGLRERLRVVGRASAHTPRVQRPPREGPMSLFFQDLRFAVRSLVKQPGFSVVVVVTVALGVGANTAMFGIVKGVLLEPLPFEEPEQLAVIYQTDRMNNTSREGASVPDYFDWLERQQSFDALAAYTGFNPTLGGTASEPERVSLSQVSHTLFPMLGWGAEVGRTFVADEDAPDGPLVAVLSHGLWQRQFGGSPSAIGRDILLDGNAYTIVGIMPAAFDFPTGSDAWVPLQYGPNSLNRGAHNLIALGRLRDGVGVEAANRDMNRIMEELERAYPDDNVGRGANVELLSEVVTGDVRPALLLLMGAVALVLLITCANVANLLLSRGSARQREIAVRAALGAGRGRLIVRLLSESTVLGLAGGALGIVLALAAVRALRVLDPTTVPRLENVGIDLPVLGFALGAAIVTGLVFGILPALRSSGTPLNDVLAEGGRSAGGVRTGRLRSALAVTQVAVAFVLVVGAGLLIKSMWNLMSVDPGFRAENLVRLSLNLPSARYPAPFSEWPNAPEVHRFHAAAVERAERLPFVTEAALALNHPLNPGWTTRVMIEGGPQTVEEGVEEERLRPVSAGFFATAGIPLLQGRDLSPTDGPDAPRVVVVNQAFVRKYFPHEPALGARIQFWGVMREIVGIVADVRFMGLDEESRPAMYPPLTQLPFTSFDVLARGSAPAEQMIDALRAEIHALDAELAVYNAESLGAVLRRSVGDRRFNMILLGVFAALALILASVGIYGVISYGVSRRTHEFGIRMSLGADPGRLRRDVLTQGLRLTVVGLAIGLAGAIAAARVIAGLLYGVEAIDPVTLAAVTVLLAAVALAASLLPATRASRVDPLAALRTE